MPKFKTHAHRFEQNNIEGDTAYASRIIRTDPAGNEHPGIGVFAGGYPRLILSPEQAVRLAHLIADEIQILQKAA